MNFSDRPYCLTIGGFDPSAGAGVLADIKTFEQLKIYGLGVNTANTVQNDSSFESINFLDKELVFDQIRVLIEAYEIKAVKIGLIPDFEWLKEIRSIFPFAYLVWDPVLSASAGFEFHEDLSTSLIDAISIVDLITPNTKELDSILKVIDRDELFNSTNILLKGGHDRLNAGTDVLYLKEGTEEFFNPQVAQYFDKHGTGCILSSAIAGYLGLGFDLSNACLNAKRYLEKVTSSNESKLAYHHL